MTKDLAQQLEKARPFLKWAGGKSQLLARMDSHLPETFDRYFEPFLGGGAVFFHLACKRGAFPAVLSDSNNELINAYITVRDRPRELMELLDVIGGAFRSEPRSRKAVFFNRERSRRPNVKTSPLENAAWFIFMNKTAFNGLYRVNKGGVFNVPYGDYPNARLYERENIEAVSRLLSCEHVKILSGDYAEVLESEGAHAGDFAYLDPPYYSKGNKGFTSYNSSLFTENDQKRLARVFEALTEKGCKMLLSNSDHDFVRRLFLDKKQYSFVSLDALRSINSKGSERRGAKELLIKNY
jgi:DNA adenine methylase